MEAVPNPGSKRSRWLTVLAAAAVLVAWFAYVGDSSGRPWLFVAVAVMIASIALRISDWKLAPPADRVAWREALIVLVGVSVLGFSLSNFHRPDERVEPYRMATTLSIPFAWMTYREAHGQKRNYWLLVGSMLGVTVLWVVAGMLFIW